MITYLNTIFSSLRGGAASIINSALSWTFSSKGFSTDELSSLDRNTSTIENTRLVESACAVLGSTSEINSNALDGFTVEGDWSSTIHIKDPAAVGALPGAGIFDKNSIQSVPVGQDGVGMSITTGSITFQIKINGNNTYNVTSTESVAGWSVITYGVADNKIFLNINGVTTVGDTMPVSYQASRWGGQPMVIGARVGGVIHTTFEAYRWQFPDGSNLPLQKSFYDISGNDNHGTPSNITWGTQDSFHYNIINGCDKYTDDATGLIEVLVPYVSGVPIVSSIANYTKQSSHPAGTYNNGAETKWILGATTFDGTGWGVEALVKTADTEEILHNNATGYGKALGYDDDKAEQGEYLFMNVATENQHKDLLLYSTPQTGTTAIAIHKFIGNGNNLVTSVSGDYVFSKDNYAVWS